MGRASVHKMDQLTIFYMVVTLQVIVSYSLGAFYIFRHLVDVRAGTYSVCTNYTGLNIGNRLEWLR